MARISAAFFIVFLSVPTCRAARNISWIGIGGTGAVPVGITAKYWFSDDNGGLRFVNLSAGPQDGHGRVFLDYAWERGRNFTGIYRGASAFLEDGGIGLGPNIGIETFRLFDVAHLNLSLDAGPFLKRSENGFEVVFYARVALRYRWSAGRSL